MRVPESWLRQWVPTDASAEQMADALTMAGLEVESLEALAPAFTGVKSPSLNRQSAIPMPIDFRSARFASTKVSPVGRLSAEPPMPEQGSGLPVRSTVQSFPATFV